MGDSEQRFKLFCAYINDLQEIKGLAPLNFIALRELYQTYASDHNTVWIDIYESDFLPSSPERANLSMRSTKTSPIGFLIIGYPPNCHPEANFYIEEAYIVPEHRRRGFMSLAVSNFIKFHPGVYCLFILKNNIAAQNFWPKVFSQHGYAPLYLRDVGAGDEYCKQYGFQKV